MFGSLRSDCLASASWRSASPLPAGGRVNNRYTHIYFSGMAGAADRCLCSDESSIPRRHFTRPPPNSARPPASRYAAYAPSGITHTPSPQCESSSQDPCSSSSYAARFVALDVYNLVLASRHKRDLISIVEETTVIRRGQRGFNLRPDCLMCGRCDPFLPQLFTDKSQDVPIIAAHRGWSAKDCI